MKAKDIMSPLHGHLKKTDTISAACRMMRVTRQNDKIEGVRALPVLDEGGRLIGIVSMGDIFKAVMPKYLGMMDLGAFTWDGMVEDMAKKAEGKLVSDIMTTEVITVTPDAPLMHCVEHIVVNGIKRIPVVSEDGNRVLGMVYERDVFFALTDIMLDKDAR